MPTSRISGPFQWITSATAAIIPNPSATNAAHPKSISAMAKNQLNFRVPARSRNRVKPIDRKSAQPFRMGNRPHRIANVKTPWFCTTPTGVGSVRLRTMMASKNA